MTTRWLRLENLALAVLAGVAFVRTDVSLWWAALWLVPDLAMVGYLAGPVWGARLYNAAHTYIGPVVLGGLAVILEADLAWALTLLWANHIGVDRALGYGLKLPTDFKDTHLGRVGSDRGAGQMQSL